MSTVVSGEIQREDEHVRVTRWTLKIGESTGQHSHAHDYIVVPLADSTMSIIEPSGSAHDLTLARGVSYSRGAGAQHTVENRGLDVVDFVEMELLWE